jgi:phospholipid/cholesterol/gamma-HCH transport system substrate-binding protein
MNNKTNYSLIGFLVLFSISLMVSFGYWLLQPSQEEEMQKYYIYYDESVLGLNLDAPVKYRGISVGNVKRLRINPKNSEQVEVLVDILKTTPIKSSTVAKLTPQGITGLSYINLTLGNSGAPALLPKEGDLYAVIKTTPSLFTRLEKTLGNVSENLSATLSRTEQLLNDENQKEIAKLLKNSAEFMDRMNKTFNDETIKDLQATMKNLNSASKKLDEIMPRIDKFVTNTVEWEDKVSGAFESIMGSYHGIKTTMDLFKSSLARGDFNIKGIANTFVPTLNNTLIQTQELMIKLQDAVNQYERSPGNILIQEEIKKGPGE